MNNMIRSTSVSVFATLALAGYGLFLLGLSLDAFALTGFWIAVVSLLLLNAAGDYAPRRRRFEPSLVKAEAHSARLPLAA